MDYREAAEAFDDAPEGLSVQSDTDVRAKIESVPSTDMDDAAVSALLLKLNASVDSMTHTGLRGRAFLEEFANAVVTHVFRPLSTTQSIVKNLTRMSTSLSFIG